MILPFSTKLNEKPTYFVDKIWSGLIDRKLATIETCRRYEYNREKVMPNDFAIVPHYKPKLHTIREDKNNRWQVGTNIDFYINVRQKNMFRFAPVLPVVSIQEVFMTYSHSDLIQISIDGRELFSYTERLEFVINDGFDNWEDFFNYFYPKIKESKDGYYKPKLIHWTDLKY